MKKILALLLVLLTFLICSCDVSVLDEVGANAGENSEKITNEITNVVTDEIVEHDDEVKLQLNDKGREVIVIPESNTEVNFDEKYKKYLPYMTNALLVEAEKKINEKSDDAGGMFYLEVDSEGYLLLKKEVIKMLPEDQRN